MKAASNKTPLDDCNPASIPLPKQGLLRRYESMLTAAPAAMIAVLCCVMPLLWTLIAMMLNPHVRHELLLTRFRAELLERTLGYNGLAAILATIMGIPAGFVLGRGRLWLSRIMWVLLPSALLMPSLSYAYGWSQLLRICVNVALQHFNEDRVHQFTQIGGSLDIFRCIWSLAAWLWAVPAGLIGLALRRMDTQVQQHALLEGALYRITLRQLLGPIIASMAIVTVMATQEFAVYEPSGISVVATELRMVFVTGAVSSPDNSITSQFAPGTGLRSPDQAARAAASVAVSLPLLGCIVLLAVIAIWGASVSSASDSITIGRWPRALDAPWWAGALAILLLMMNVGLPVWALAHSLRVRFSIPEMFNTFGPNIEGAIIVGCIAAVVAMVAALSSAGGWTPGLLALTGASFVIGGQLLAIAQIRIYNRVWLDWLYNAWPLPVIAYLGRFGWLAMAAGRATWTPAWKELRDMAALDGAGPFCTAASVVWPLAWPILLAGGLMVGALSLTEVPATVLLSPAHPLVLTPLLMTWLHQQRSDDMIKASLLMMLAVLLPAIAGVLLTAIGLRMGATWGRKPAR